MHLPVRLRMYPFDQSTYASGHTHRKRSAYPGVAIVCLSRVCCLPCCAIFVLLYVSARVVVLVLVIVSLLVPVVLVWEVLVVVVLLLVVVGCCCWRWGLVRVVDGNSDSSYDRCRQFSPFLEPNDRNFVKVWGREDGSSSRPHRGLLGIKGLSRHVHVL